MSKTFVLFIQGGGDGARAADRLLATSLQGALGAGYDVRFPAMPHEGAPDVAAWKAKIGSTLSPAWGRTILVAHSMGAAILLRYLAEEKVEAAFEGVFLLAAPSRDHDRWNFDDLELPPDAAARLAAIPRLVFYHCHDDAVVPFSHLALQARRFPRAVTHALARGGHQFDGDLSRVAADIRSDDAA